MYFGFFFSLTGYFIIKNVCYDYKAYILEEQESNQLK